MATTTLYTVLDGEVISENRNGVSKFYVPDPLGSTRVLLDNTQTKTDTFSYWPYGEVQSRTGTTPTPFQYIGSLGYYQDAPSRNYVRKRYLDNYIGRWLTRDPIDMVKWNAYSYAMSQPTVLVDPTGLAPVPCMGEPLQICQQTCKGWGIESCWMDPAVCDPTTGLPQFECRCKHPDCARQLALCLSDASEVYNMCAATVAIAFAICMAGCGAYTGGQLWACRFACGAAAAIGYAGCNVVHNRMVRSCYAQYDRCKAYWG